VVGDTVRVCGSGWAEPVPVCDYHFFFDGVEVAPPQPDGLFGPPNSSFVVPASAAGQHSVRVDLSLTADGTLIQSRQVPFLVVASKSQPISASVMDGGHSIRIEYDPSKACIPDCTEIYFIQTRNTRRILNDGTDEHLPYNEPPHNWPNGSQIEDWFVNDVAIDRIFGSAVPYYGIPPGAARVGKKDGIRLTTARMDDRPTRSDRVYAANVVTIRILFDVNAFCGAGDAAGLWLGNFTWQWSRNRGVADARGTVTLGAPSDAQPTPAFLAALSRWIDRNPGFRLPVPRFQDCVQ
jgi:hypothetical protein